jgi:hypothetical protein
VLYISRILLNQLGIPHVHFRNSSVPVALLHAVRSESRYAFRLRYVDLVVGIEARLMS